MRLGALTKRRRGWYKLARTSKASPVKTDFVQTSIESILGDLVKLRVTGTYTRRTRRTHRDLVKAPAQALLRERGEETLLSSERGCHFNAAYRKDRGDYTIHMA